MKPANTGPNAFAETIKNAALRIGFVGAGGNTLARHFPGFRALPGVEFVAVANRTRESAERVAAEWGVGRVEADWRAVVEAPDIDAVCIGTWPDLHASVACAALAAGKHVLCEARMAATLGEARAMLAVSRANPSLTAQLVPAPHTLAVDEAVAAWIASGEAGAWREIRVTHRHGDYLNPATPISWRLQSRHSGVNMLTLGIFYEVLLRWLDADAAVTSARAEIATPRRRDAAGGWHEVDLPEALAVEGEFAALGGAALRMELSGLWPGEPELAILLRGERAELRWDGRRGTVETRAIGEADWRTRTEAKGDAWAVEREFVSCIREGTTVRRTDFATGERYMRFTDAAWRALAFRTNEPAFRRV